MLISWLRSVNVICAVLLVLLISATGAKAGDSIWTAFDGTGAWLNASNWAGIVIPGSYTLTTNTDLATFNIATNPTDSIDFGATSGTYYLGAIDFNSSTNRSLGNGATSATGILTLNGRTLNGVSNVILHNSGTGIFSIPTSTPTISLALGNAMNNVILVEGIGGITITSSITGSGKKLTLQGGGDLMLQTSNSFSGGTVINAGRLISTNSSQTVGSGTNNTITVNSGGEFYFMTSGLTYFNDNFTISGFGGNSIVDPVQRGALRIDAGATIGASSSGTITLAADSSIDSNTTGGNISAPITGTYNLYFNKGGFDTAPIGLSSTSSGNTFSGTLAIQGGTVTLTGAFPSNPTLSVGTTGIFTYSKTGTNSQTFNGLSVTAGFGTVNDTISTDTLVLGGITRNGGGMVNFATATGSITTTKTNTNNIIGPWATFGTGLTLKYAVGTSSVVPATITGLTGTSAGTAASLTDTTGTVNYDLTLSSGATPASVSANTIRYIGALAALAPGATLFSVNGLMNAGSGTWTIGTNAITIGSTKELVVTSNTTSVTITSVIKDNSLGASSLTYGGGGTLTLSAASANLYTGGTVLNSGTLSLGTGTATLGSGSLTLSGGTFTTASTIAANTNIPNSVVVTANTTTNVVSSAAGNNITFTSAGSFTGSGNFQDNSTTTGLVLIQSSINNFTGTFTYVNTSSTGNNLAFGGATVNSNSLNGSQAKFMLSGTNSSSGATGRSLGIGLSTGSSTFQMGALSGTAGYIGPNNSSTNVTLQVGALNTNTSYAGIMTDTNPAATVTGSTLALTKVGTGSLILSGINTNSGGTNVQNGTLQVTLTGTLGATVNAVTEGAGSAGTIGTVGNLVINTTAGTTTIGSFAAVSNTSDTTTASNINQLTILPTKTLAVGGAFTVGLAGTSAGSTNTALGTGAVGTGGTLTVGGTFTAGVSGSVTGTETVAVDLSGLNAFSQTNTSGSMLIGSGATVAATLTLAGNNNIISVGTLSVGDSGTNSPSASTLSLGSGSNVFKIGSGGITIGAGQGSGTIQFSGSGGTVSITDANGNGTSNITLGNANNGTYGVGTSALSLAGHQAHVSAATVIVGELTGASSGAPNATVTFDTGGFVATNTIQLALSTSGSSSGSPRGTFTVGGPSANSAASGVLSVSGNFILAGNTNSTPGATGTATGSLIINGGSVYINDSGSATGGIFDISNSTTGSSATTLTLAGGLLDLGNGVIGGTTGVGMVNIGTLNFLSGMLQNVAEINNGAVLNKTSSGMLILAGTNTFTGGTTVSAGTVQIGVSSITSGSGATMAIVSSATGTGLVTVNGTLDLSYYALAVGGLSGAGAATNSSNGTTTGTLTIVTGATPQTFSGTIIDGTNSVAMSVTVAGSGVQTFSGTNSYTGSTTIMSGTLIVSSTGTINSSAGGVNVNGGLLRGTGTIIGPVTVNSGATGGGTIKAGSVDGTVGTLTLSGTFATTAATMTSLVAATIAVELNDGSPTPGSNGGSTVGLPNNVTSNSFFKFGSTVSIDATTNITVLVDANNYTPGQSYSYTIGTTSSTMTITGPGSITNANQFTFTGLAVSSSSLSTDGMGDLFLSFTVAVPEPSALLGVAAFALLALRRRSSQQLSLAS